MVQEEAKRQGMVFIPPYDDPYVIAGQGTAGAEILRQLSSQQKEDLEAIFVAIGGGGLAAGIAAYTKQLLPHVKVFGVEPTGAWIHRCSAYLRYLICCPLSMTGQRYRNAVNLEKLALRRALLLLSCF